MKLRGLVKSMAEIEFSKGQRRGLADAASTHSVTLSISLPSLKSGCCLCLTFTASAAAATAAFSDSDSKFRPIIAASGMGHKH